MANAYSTPINYGHAISTMDIVQLTGQVQTALQQRFDVNVAKVDDLIQKITSVPLVRDQDKKYLGDRLQGLLSMVDANSKVDMTNNNVARQVNNYISTAIDDNVKTQIGNSQKIQGFQQEAARIKKEKPELYNDANYAYALDKSGYAAYMNGETNDLGNLQYKEYYDVTKNLNEPLDKWAKERGFERVVDTNVQGGYIYQTVKGKRITPEEIDGFVNNRIQSDTKLKDQLMINSHYKYRGVSDESLLKEYQDQAKPLLNKYDVTLSSIDVDIKNTNPDDKAKLETLNQKKAYTSQQKEFFESQLDPKNFNRDNFLFKNETHNLIESYKKTFGYSEITDIENDDFYKSNKGTGTGKGTGLGTGAAQGLPAGTAFTSVEEKVNEKEKESPLSLYEKGRDASYKEFKQIVKQQLQKEGKSATDKDVNNYYINLKKASKEGTDINAQGFSPEVLESYKKVEYHNKLSYNLKKAATEYYSKDVNETLNGLFGGKAKGLKVEGLAITMPYTAELLKKYKDSSQLNAKQKAIASYEIANNIKEYILTDEDDKKRMNFYIEGIKQDNKISSKDLEKYKPEEEGFWSGAWDAIAGGVREKWNREIAPVISQFYFGNEGENRKKALKEDAEGWIQGMAQSYKGSKKFGKAWDKAFSEDTDLSEIESGDIKLKNYQGVSDRVLETKGSVASKFDLILKQQEANLDKTMSVVLSSGNKGDVPYIDAVKSALYAQGKSPEKGTNILIQKVENGIATVSFDNELLIPKEKGGQTKEVVRDTVQIPVSNLPSNLMSSMQTNKTEWAYSKSNPQEMKVLLHYKPFADLDSRYEFSNKYLGNYANTLPENITELIQKTNFSEFKTKEELLDVASKYLPKEYLQEYSTNVLNANYSVNWERKSGAFYPTLMKNGKMIKNMPPVAIDYNTHTFNTNTMSLINSYLENEIMERRKQVLQTQIR
jgi:hypothetical protein